MLSKERIIEDVSITTEPDVLNGYIVVWSTQPYIEKKLVDDITKKYQVHCNLKVKGWEPSPTRKN